MKTTIGVLLICVLFGCNSNTANDNHQENVKLVISENQSPQEKSDQNLPILNLKSIMRMDHHSQIHVIVHLII